MLPLYFYILYLFFIAALVKRRDDEDITIVPKFPWNFQK
jgi:hypothetical protein